jgi:hypothetical protein
LAKLVQDSLETVDLIFDKGVDWRAFTYSFHKTQIENEGTPLAICSIENKGDGVVLIRVSVPHDIDKGKVYNDFRQVYEFAQKALESQYQSRLEDKDKEINRLFYLVNQLQNQLGEVPKLMSEAKKEYTFQAPVGSVENQGHIASSGIKTILVMLLEKLKPNRKTFNTFTTMPLSKSKRLLRQQRRFRNS